MTKFTLELEGGKKGLLENSENLCRKPQRAAANFTGHNGKVLYIKPLVAKRLQEVEEVEEEEERKAQRAIADDESLEPQQSDLATRRLARASSPWRSWRSPCPRRQPAQWLPRPRPSSR